MAIRLLKTAALSDGEQMIQLSPGVPASKQQPPGRRWRRPGANLSRGLHSGAVLLTGLQPFMTVFHYCTKSR